MGLSDGKLGDIAGSLLARSGEDAAGGGIQQLLGGLLGGGAQGSSSSMLTTALALVQQHGGLDGISQKLKSGGLGDVVQSWIGSGANASVTGAELEGALVARRSRKSRRRQA